MIILIGVFINTILNIMQNSYAFNSRTVIYMLQTFLECAVETKASNKSSSNE